MPKPILVEEPRILYQDDHILAVYKPPNMPTQKDASGDYSLVEWVRDMVGIQRKEDKDTFVGLVHRLDRPVPGVMVFATTKGSAAILSDAFKKREISKHYLCVVEGTPLKEAGRVVDLIQSKGRSIPKEAVLDYQVLASHEEFSLLRIDLITGRHHQIRVQLSSIGHPIVNDARYGKVLFPHRCIGLLSWRIVLKHPITKGPLEFRSHIPKAFPWDGDLSCLRL